jgi:hypothetical protein
MERQDKHLAAGSQEGKIAGKEREGGGKEGG